MLKMARFYPIYCLLYTIPSEAIRTTICVKVIWTTKRFSVHSPSPLLGTYYERREASPTARFTSARAYARCVHHLPLSEHGDESAHPKVSRRSDANGSIPPPHEDSTDQDRTRCEHGCLVRDSGRRPFIGQTAADLQLPLALPARFLPDAKSSQ